MDTSFPYNPDERILSARIANYQGDVKVNGDASNITQKSLKTGDEITVRATGMAEIYFSDGSKSVL
jgi:RNA-binding protein YlmH